MNIADETREIGKKSDQSKPMVSLIDPMWLLDTAAVLSFGAKKYSKDNWKYVDNPNDRYLSAAYRHLLAFQSGEVNDPESGLPHIAHATCCLMFLHYVNSEGESNFNDLLRSITINANNTSA